MAEIFTPTEVSEWLTTNLPTWQLQKNRLLRIYKTPNWQVTLMVANAIGYLAEAANHHPELILNYPSVEVHLETHDAGGITAKDFELARKIEEVVLWLPGAIDARAGQEGKWVA